MSVKAVSWALEVKGLNPTQRCVLICLADCHNGHTGRCDPKQQTIADTVEVSLRTVWETLRQLDEKGLISRVQRLKEKGRGRSSDLYTLNGDQLAKSAVESPRPSRKKTATNSQTVAVTREPEVSEPTDTPNGVSAERGHPAVAAFMESAKGAGYGNAAALLSGRVAGQVKRAEKAGVARSVIVKAAAYCGANDRSMAKFANYCADIEAGHAPGRREPKGFGAIRRARERDNGNQGTDSSGFGFPVSGVPQLPARGSEPRGLLQAP